MNWNIRAESGESINKTGEFLFDYRWLPIESSYFQAVTDKLNSPILPLML